jgi:predicted RNase H-like nuclease (RuvC/YqgF family)
MKLVESAFEYQKEIMELKQEKAMKSKMVEIAKKKNEYLKKRKEETTQYIQSLESRLKDAKSKKEIIQTRTKELKKMETILVHYGMSNKPIPHDIMLRCKQESTARR